MVTESTFVTGNNKFLDEERDEQLDIILGKLLTVHYENGVAIIKDANYGVKEAKRDIKELWAWVV